MMCRHAKDGIYNFDKFQPEFQPNNNIEIPKHIHLLYQRYARIDVYIYIGMKHDLLYYKSYFKSELLI